MRITSLKKRGTPVPIPNSHHMCNLHTKYRTLYFGNFCHKKRKFAESYEHSHHAVYFNGQEALSSMFCQRPLSMKSCK